MGLNSIKIESYLLTIIAINFPSWTEDLSFGFPVLEKDQHEVSLLRFLSLLLFSSPCQEGDDWLCLLHRSAALQGMFLQGCDEQFWKLYHQKKYFWK